MPDRYLLVYGHGSSTYRPGFQGKFEKAWAEVKEGPDYAVSILGKSKPKVLHANLLKVWHSTVAHIHVVLV